MNKDITIPALIVIVGFIFVYCMFGTPSDAELLDNYKIERGE